MPGGKRRNTTAAHADGGLESGKQESSSNNDSRLSLVVQQRTVNYDSNTTQNRKDSKKTQIRPDQNQKLGVMTDNGMNTSQERMKHSSIASGKSPAAITRSETSEKEVDCE